MHDGGSATLPPDTRPMDQMTIKKRNAGLVTLLAWTAELDERVGDAGFGWSERGGGEREGRERGRQRQRDSERGKHPDCDGWGGNLSLTLGDVSRRNSGEIDVTI